MKILVFWKVLKQRKGNCSKLQDLSVILVCVIVDCSFPFCVDSFQIWFLYLFPKLVMNQFSFPFTCPTYGSNYMMKEKDHLNQQERKILFFAKNKDGVCLSKIRLNEALCYFKWDFSNKKIEVSGLLQKWKGLMNKTELYIYTWCLMATWMWRLKTFEVARSRFGYECCTCLCT